MSNIFWLLPGKRQALLVTYRVIIHQWLQEEWNIQGNTLGTDAFYVCLFDLVDLCVFIWIIIHQDFDGLCTRLNQASHAPLWQQIWHTTFDAEIVARLFIGKQYSGSWSTTTKRPQPIFRVQQHCCGIRREDLGDRSFECMHIGCRCLTMLTARVGNGLHEIATMIYRQRSDHSTLVGTGIDPFKFTLGNLDSHHHILFLLDTSTGGRDDARQGTYWPPGRLQQEHVH